MNDLTIGLVVSFGGLFMMLVFVVLRAWMCPQLGSSWFRDKDAEGIIRLELTVSAYDDFTNGRLTTKLYREIAHLYALKGDLSAYKELAGRQRHTYLIEFLKDPTRHPMVIHGKLRGDIPVGAAAPIQPATGAETGAEAGDRIQGTDA